MLAGVGGRVAAARAGREAPQRNRRRARRLGWALALAVACAGLFALYLSQSLTAPVNSDGAANVLQGQALSHGNPLLRGWWTSDVSFYSTELPLYALVMRLRGLSPYVVHLCGALTYTLTVLLTALLARGRGPGRAGWYGAGIAAGIMLAPSVLGGTQVFLENPDHAGTAVPVLLLLLLLDQLRLPGPGEPAKIAGPGPHWLIAAAVAAAACALLALAKLGDPLSLAAATVPLAAVCAVRLAAAAARRRPLYAFRDDGLLLAAAAGSVELTRLATAVIRAHGGYDVRPIRDTVLVPLRQVPANARALWRSLILLFGANGPGAPGRPFTAARHLPLAGLADLHVIGLLLALAGLLAGIAGIGRGRAGLVTQVLVAAIAVMVAAGAFSSVLRSLANAHEVAVLLPLGAALAGRALPPLARRLAPARSGHARPPARPARVRGPRLAGVALACWLGLGAAELAYAATWPAAPAPMRAVAAWLTAHHERAGLAGYWQADVTTVESGGRVLVAPVTRQGATVDRWESSAAWYLPRLSRATFVIAVPGPPGPGGSLNPAVARARFGPPAGRYLVGGDIIMTYRYNLLTRLAHRNFPGSP